MTWQAVAAYVIMAFAGGFHLAMLLLFRERRLTNAAMEAQHEYIEYLEGMVVGKMVRAVEVEMKRNLSQ